MSEQQIQKVKVKRLAHIGLWTTDIVTQVRFYRQVMGFDLRTTEHGQIEQDFENANVFLSLGNEHHCLGLFSDTRSGVRPAAQRTRLHHMALEVGTNAELAALAARLQQSNVDVTLGERDGDPELGDTLWFNDPDDNRIEISVTPDELLTPSAATNRGRASQFRPHSLQHLALQTLHLETMVDFYTEALGFDISDWLLRECAWLRCNNDHHTIMLTKGKPDIDHIGYNIPGGPEVLAWADYLGQQQTPILWGPGRHGAGNNLFLRVADPDGTHIELSAELQQYYDHDSSTPPRLWHARPAALNLWGTLPTWIHQEVRA